LTEALQELQGVTHIRKELKLKEAVSESYRCWWKANRCRCSKRVVV